LELLSRLITQVGYFPFQLMQHRFTKKRFLRAGEGFEDEAMSNVKAQSSNENQKSKVENTGSMIRNLKEKIF